MPLSDKPLNRAAMARVLMLAPMTAKLRSVGDRVAEEVECVCFQSLRLGELPCNHLHEEHYSVDGYHGPEDALVARVDTIEDRDASGATASLDTASIIGDRHRDRFRKIEGRRLAAGVGGATVLVGHRISLPQAPQRTTSSD